MISELKDFSYPFDMVPVNYSKVERILLDRNIKIRHLMRNKSNKFRLPKNIELESDNNFWGVQDSVCSIGAFSYTSGTRFDFGVKVGRYCSIAENSKIMGAEHFSDWISTSPVFYDNEYHDQDTSQITHQKRQARKVNIGNDVWIGADVVFKPNITIGDGAIIASNSVVTKDVPPYAIVGGVPARVIRYRFNDDLIKAMQSIEWWKYHKKDLKGLVANNPITFIENLEKRISNNEIQEYKPELLTIKHLTES